VRTRPSRTKPEVKLAVPSPPPKTRESRVPQHPVHALIPTIRPSSEEDSDSLASVAESSPVAQKVPSGGRGKRRAAASGDENSDIEEFNYEETLQKRGRGSRRLNDAPSSKLRRLGDAAAVSSHSLASSASVNNSLASGEESGSEDGSEDPRGLRVTIPSRYTTRARSALGDKGESFVCLCSLVQMLAIPYI